jgi:polyisoprenoid-binding protein YceI
VESKTISVWFKKAGAAAVFASAIFAMASARPSGARAETWNLDPVHSNISFSARHMMISDVRGEFDKFSGAITANDDDPKSVQIEATIDAASINTRSEMRDKDLKGPNFLDVTKYPTLTFKSVKIEPDGDGKWKVTGDLTLHGVTKLVVLEVTGPSPEIKDPYGNTRRGASATTTINRQDFGIAFNKTLDSGGMVVGNDVAITIDVEAVKKAAK